ncbi:unnamed protein product [Schistosoma curassoni]|uniref:Reverse transcriptase domain-containing protein n=1 Tax=Schistosoma curassoni TaxID=6186 RepID=A0A183JR45_9TREM|nr:unnamed protein product [Schistosoma curassoni]
MEDNWKWIKEALTSNCQEVLGLKRHHHNECISIDSLIKIQQGKNNEAEINNSRTRTEKVEVHTQYTPANKQVSIGVRGDKQKYVKHLAMTDEKAATKGNMKQLSDTTKKPTGKYSKPERSVKFKIGNPITDIQK